MASLEKRYDFRYRIVSCWQGERRYHPLGRMPEQEARSCLDRLTMPERLSLLAQVGKGFTMGASLALILRP
jgi:hypothetical protein